MNKNKKISLIIFILMSFFIFFLLILEIKETLEIESNINVINDNNEYILCINATEYKKLAYDEYIKIYINKYNYIFCKYLRNNKSIIFYKIEENQFCNNFIFYNNQYNNIYKISTYHRYPLYLIIKYELK